MNVFFFYFALTLLLRQSNFIRNRSERRKRTCKCTNFEKISLFLGTLKRISITPAEEINPSGGTVAETEPTMCTEYAYNRKGQLVVKGYSYSRSGIKGALNTAIEWRCVDGRKLKCNARVRTLGKTLQIINIVHNHEPKKQKQFNAIVWNENEEK